MAPDEVAADLLSRYFLSSPSIPVALPHTIPDLPVREFVYHCNLNTTARTRSCRAWRLPEPSWQRFLSLSTRPVM